MWFHKVVIIVASICGFQLSQKCPKISQFDRRGDILLLLCMFYSYVGLLKNLVSILC